MYDLAVTADPPSTRDRLIRATRDAIRDVGLPATTAREIVGRASANLASIPYHFESKDALVAEALVADVRDLVAPVLTLLGGDRPAAERATEAVAMLDDLFEVSRPQVPVYLAALATASHTPRVRRDLGSLWADLRARLADDIARQVDDGRLPGWVSPSAMAGAILSLVNGVIVASVIDPDGPGHREMAAQYLGLLLAAGAPGAGGGSDGGTVPPAGTSRPDGGTGRRAR
jgi:AcrR family transcriptional regulator